MDLNKDETLVHEEGGSYFKDFVAIGGQITLTTQRILFSSNRKDSACPTMEIPLSEIDKVDYFKTLNVIPNGLMLMLTNGSIDSFVVDDRVEWKNRIVGLLESRLSV
ncbi:MAG: hypothetical protein ACI84C_001964 [Flavobacteriales bacterium]|jgi:hypothetical protein